MVEDGLHHSSPVDLYGVLTDAGAIVPFVGRRIGIFVGNSGEKIEADKSMENAPAFLFDALLLPDGREAIQALACNDDMMEFVKDQFRHCKTILACGAGQELLALTGIGSAMDKDPGILLADSADAGGIAAAFIDAVAAHRHSSRDSDSPAK